MRTTHRAVGGTIGASFHGLHEARAYGEQLVAFDIDTKPDAMDWYHIVDYQTGEIVHDTGWE